MAANLGDVADTTAVLCGQVAGAYYDRFGIHASWIDKLSKRDEIINLASQLHIIAVPILLLIHVNN